jgi:phosphatidylinositol glycan class B
MEIVLVAIVTLLITVGIDSSSIGYNEFTVVFWNFLQFNLFGGGSGLYGIHPWHWYFSEGLPAILGTHLPLVILGLQWSGEFKGPIFIWAIFYVLCSSIAAHKEFRFILPILPALFMYGGFCLSFIKQHKLEHMIRVFPGVAVFRNTLLVSLTILVLVPNFVASWYLSVWHQAGPLCVMDRLRDEIHSRNTKPDTDDGEQPDENLSIHFLTPCHATPMYSHLHLNVSIWYPDCSPRQRAEIGGSESFKLMETDTAQFVDNLYGQGPDNTTCWGGNICDAANRAQLPTFIVLFQPTATKLKYFLARNQYTLLVSCWHSHLSGDAEEEEPNSHMVVYRHGTGPHLTEPFPFPHT